MDFIVSIITMNTITLLAAIIIGTMILLAIIKKFSRLFIAAVVVLAFYAGYLYFSGQIIPTTKDEIIRHGAEQVEKFQLNKKAADLTSGIKDGVKSNSLKINSEI